VLKHITETVKDNTNEASQTGPNINVSKAEYMVNIMKYGNEPEETETNRNSRNFLNIIQT
jgi:hypothetical protein